MALFPLHPREGPTEPVAAKNEAAERSGKRGSSGNLDWFAGLATAVGERTGSRLARSVSMAILVVNAGSTSVKYKLFGADAETLLAGIIEYRATGFVSELHKQGGRYVREITEREFRSSGELILQETEGRDIECIGFRVVHGGEYFTAPTRLTDEVTDRIEELGRLAPLHNPPAVEKIRELRRLLPDTPQYAVFDTAFHSTLPAEAFIYSIPCELYEKHGIRKYGFHGISHKYVSGRLKELEPQGRRQIICHLGGGASITAVRDGSSVETSMGFTPLEGLTMATRSGDLDPGVVLHLMENLDFGLDDVKRMLNERSGLLGLSKQTADMRILLERERAGDGRAALAVAVYVHDIRRYVGAYAAVLGGLDVLAFTAGVGCGSDEVRRRVCGALSWLGLEIDDAVNDGARNPAGELRISAAGSKPVWVVPTNEELQIFKEISPLK